MKRVLPIFVFGLLLLSCRKENDESSLLEGNVPVTRVMVGGKVAVYDSQTATFLATLPTETDFSSMDVGITTEAPVIRSGERTLAMNNTRVDLRTPLPVRVIKDGVYRDFFIAVRNTGLPVVRIETPWKKSITSKTVWMDGAKIRIENPDGTVDYEGTMEIRGRGNSTWNW